eukprot:TRINITY_DN8091_c0_g2_i6.p1 TRINITY_DN8091_c0_g2~~TRINITY_DN8091_c0_g2_i6.p1  ORF type:complete len:268 (-),score=53.18 TRINITY_DN8091_c0_g2_i6:1037-1840(-)
MLSIRCLHPTNLFRGNRNSSKGHWSFSSSQRSGNHFDDHSSSALEQAYIEGLSNHHTITLNLDGHSSSCKVDFLRMVITVDDEEYFLFRSPNHLPLCMRNKSLEAIVSDSEESSEGDMDYGHAPEDVGGGEENGSPLAQQQPEGQSQDQSSGSQLQLQSQQQAQPQPQPQPQLQPQTRPEPQQPQPQQSQPQEIQTQPQETQPQQQNQRKKSQAPSHSSQKFDGSIHKIKVHRVYKTDTGKTIEVARGYFHHDCCCHCHFFLCSRLR